MNIAIIFAGGIGSRMGSDMPKQFLEWNNKPILIHTLDVFDKHPRIDAIIIACKTDWIEYTQRLIVKFGIKKVIAIVPGGYTALDSQYNALCEAKKLFPNSDVNVLIHDGVRPLVDGETIQKNIDSVERFGCTITVTNAIETVINVNEDGRVVSVLDRKNCRMAKAPQSFKLDDILEAHRRAINDNNHNFIDSASMMLDYGFELYTVDGTAENIKITTPSDYYMFLGISKNKADE